MSDIVLSVQGLTKVYGNKTVVNGVDFEVQKGEILGILGHNGAGKTTLVECIQGLKKRDGGLVSIFGVDPENQRHKVRDTVGSQLQQSELPAKLRIGEAFKLFSKSRNIDVAGLLNEWGLDGKEHEYYGSLSGGQRQRLFIALALINEPKIIFLDELTNALDPFARRDVWESVKKVRQKGITVVLVSHFIEEVEELCDRIIIMKQGAIVASGTIAEIKTKFADEVTIRFETPEISIPVGWLNSVPGIKMLTLNGKKITLIGSQEMVLHAGSVMLEHGFEPRNMEIHQASLEEAFIKINEGNYA